MNRHRDDRQVGRGSRGEQGPFTPATANAGRSGRLSAPHRLLDGAENGVGLLRPCRFTAVEGDVDRLGVRRQHDVHRRQDGVVGHAERGAVGDDVRRRRPEAIAGDGEPVQIPFRSRRGGREGSWLTTPRAGQTNDVRWAVDRTRKERARRQRGLSGNDRGPPDVEDHRGDQHVAAAPGTPDGTEGRGRGSAEWWSRLARNVRASEA
jgi:hypothetical protein